MNAVRGVNLYLDTSALVKRYDPLEPSASRVIELCDQPNCALYTSSLTGPEVASALRRKEREKKLGPEGITRAWSAFQAHASGEYRLLAVSDKVLRDAEWLLLHYQLRAHDAVHIASARAVQAVLLRATFTFVTADAAQAQVARVVGLDVTQV